MDQYVDQENFQNMNYWIYWIENLIAGVTCVFQIMIAIKSMFLQN